MLKQTVFSPATIRSALRSAAFVRGIQFLLLLFSSNLLLTTILFIWSSSDFLEETTQELIVEERQVRAQYHAGGIEGVIQYLDNYENGVKRYRYAFMLFDNENNKLVGQLDPSARYRDARGSWWEKQFGVLWQESVDKQYLASEFDLPDGYRLVLAAYLGEKQLIAGNFLSLGIVTTLFALLISVLLIFFTALKYVDVLEPVNRDIDIVMKGDLSHRLALRGEEQELDKLVSHINEMLDRIQELMSGVKQVSDNIAHDLRTPLTRLRNNLVSYERHTNTEHKEAVHALIAEADGLIKTFNSLLRIARIELNEDAHHHEIVRMDELVYEVIELYEPVAAEKGIGIDSCLNSVSISVERNLIFQAVANLLDNAIKYTPSQGKITVTLGNSAVGAPQLTVVDTGRGIQEENMNKVFRRFFREDSSRALESGNGLGLSLVMAVLKIHRANIELKNCHPGLAVTITFPMLEQTD